jgi:arylsulfatase A-like enzyme
VQLPPRARLRLGYGLHRASHLDDEARFEVRLDPERGKSALLLAETLWAEGSSWYWHERLIDLDRWAGQEVEIALVTWSALDHPVYALWASPALEVPRAAADPPNVILIAIDTLRADRLGSLGHSGGLTPHLDALAGDGVLFRQAVSPGNWTLPAFASLFTGQGAHQHGVLRHTDALAPAATTLAETLRRAGWTTEAILYKPTLYLGNRLEQGFERYFNVPILAPRGDLNLEKTVRWLERNGDRRFFLFLHFNDPHLPLAQPWDSLPAELLQEMKRFGVSGPPVDLEAAWESCRRRLCAHPTAARDFMAMGRALYDREVAYVDAFIGQFAGELERSSLYEDAVIALVSDHGETLWEHDAYYGHGGPNFRDSLVRVPLIVKPPVGRGPAPGTEIAAQVSTADLAATLLELAGLPVAETEVGGSSLSRFWSGQTAGARVEAPAFSLGSQGESVRRGGFRYMREIRPAGGGAEWLFDLARDPGEHVDAASREPALFEEMRALAVEESARWAAGGALVLVRVGAGAGADELVLIFSAPASRQEFDSFGLALAGCEGRVCRYAGSPRGRLALADLFAAPLEAEVEIELRSPGRPVWRERLDLASAAALAPGAVARFLAGGGPGALVLWAAPGRATAGGEAPSVRSAEQLEALEALGYLDE